MTDVDFTCTFAGPDYHDAVRAIGNGTYDIGIGDFSVSYSRTQIVDFTSYTAVDSYTLADFLTTDTSFKVDKLLRWKAPFSWSVWIATVGCLLVLSATVWLYTLLPTTAAGDERLVVAEGDIKTNKNPNSRTRNLLESSWVAVFQPFGGPTTIKKGRWVTVVGSFTFWIVIALYSAQLTAYISVDSQRTSVVSGVEYIKEHNLKVAIQHGSITDELAARLGIRNLESFQNFTAMFSAVISGSVDLAITATGTLRAASFGPPYCTVNTIATVWKHPWAFPVSKNISNKANGRDLLHVINEAMLQLREQGLPELLTEKFVLQDSQCPPVVQGVEGARFSTWGGVLMMLVLLLLVTLLRITFRWFWFRKRKSYWEQSNISSRNNRTTTTTDKQRTKNNTHPPPDEQMDGGEGKVSTAVSCWEIELQQAVVAQQEWLNKLHIIQTQLQLRSTELVHQKASNAPTSDDDDVYEVGQVSSLQGALDSLFQFQSPHQEHNGVLQAEQRKRTQQF
eukprot:TRINITY_DN112396_c0_g1_i1.p1 TRINITY_DN112396_c0_g1~~TRINITY_DN112396_c0_g1_i1.p1  ORF type:complete len:568 (+),score=58.77 TRINITY_DN112396_c0_g1_i1:186-1706(+)